MAKKQVTPEKEIYYVPLHDDEEVVGRVPYTSNLDYWDGHNWTCGSTGRHLGVGRTESGVFYLVHGTQWQGERDYAEIVSEEQAKASVMKANDNDLFRRLFGTDIPVGAPASRSRGRSIYLSDDLWTQIERQAGEQNRSVSQIISEILAAHISETREGERQQ